ncbi:nucleolar MIF4G domain-containing protein 1-like isoform X1 [Schistocerca americana]|uniref:nucleolar MIF4G domain-containing protein 1-like isoform X1 n=1 Tax=Schistocerca americana TaxID=7009 RepID=UPI001F4FCF9B|nr:nucleolar MIF4G domain-containing protein 1-like isoform X1 [Schistocerca americana]
MQKHGHRLKGKKHPQKGKKNAPTVLSRKEKRKEQRKSLKIKKREYFANKRRTPGLFVRAPEDVRQVEKPNESSASNEGDRAKKRFQKEQQRTKALKQEMKKSRDRQLLEANKEEDKIIRKLEKQLKLNKRKSKSIPKSFSSDGLDYLLEVCDSENLRDVVTSEQNVFDACSDIDDDFTALFGKSDSDQLNNIHNMSAEDSDFVDTETDSQVSAEESDAQEVKHIGIHEGSTLSSNAETCFSKGWSVTDLQANDGSDTKKKTRKRKLTIENEGLFTANQKKVKSNKNKNGDEEINDSEEALLDGIEGVDAKVEEFWEDIYGRTRDKAGNIVKRTTGKYVPPHMRLKNEAEDDKKQLLLLRLKKQMKGLLNRLSEGNMKNIATQVEQLYMSNSRHDMNKILSELLMESLVVPVRTPERLIMEHALLVAVLHSNVDTEVGIHFLQASVKRFHELCSEIKDTEDKQLDNIVLIISHLYNFKVFDSVLMYDILEVLSETFTEKEIELILIILKSVGFTLRKDNPIALKELILRLQQKAGSSEHLRENTRVKFMLDVLLAIKNNNMAKIPNFDPTHSEHLKKLLKGILHKGAYVTEVKLTLQDLLKADQQGRWWVVGSAWTGVLPLQEGGKTSTISKKDTAYSSQLLELARKQRMNTDVRRDIFCIVMTAEDYLDSFEKLLHLGLKNQQEREIIHVTLDCCLQEKRYNPYYSHLIQKFCDFDRKYQMITQCAVWDKLKELSRLSQFQVPNLAQLLIHLFINKGLALSTLKVINFGEVNKATVHLLRQILLGILLHESQDNMQEVFCRVSLSPKLQMFRESMRIFIKHFVLRNSMSLPTSQLTLLNQRAEVVDRILSTNMSKIRPT